MNEEAPASCPSCGSTVTTNATYCSTCGKPLFVTTEAHKRGPRAAGLVAVVVVVLVGGLALGAYLVASKSPALSDAELVWCKAHADVVGLHADELGLPPPATAATWTEWGVLVVYGGLAGGWDGYTTEFDRPDRDRACKAAFATR